MNALLIAALIVIVLWVVILILFLITTRRQPDLRSQMQTLDDQLNKLENESGKS